MTNTVSYLTWDKKTITDFSDKNINSLYAGGYLFTRIGHGIMNQTRSVRVDLSKFKLSSENKRILKKTEKIEMEAVPLPYTEYDWTIGKMGKDFYEKKFALNQTLRVGSVFTANKIKEMMTNEVKSNFNLIFIYKCHSERSEESPGIVGDPSTPPQDDTAIGYAICRATDEILHYCYPFYDLEKTQKDIGLGMMTRAIVWAKENGKKYAYLGSYKDSKAKYKLQFDGVEWFNKEKWNDDINLLKKIL